MTLALTGRVFPTSPSAGSLSPRVSPSPPGTECTISTVKTPPVEGMRAISPIEREKVERSSWANWMDEVSEDRRLRHKRVMERIFW